MQDIVDRLFRGLDPGAFRQWQVPFFLCTEDVRAPEGFEERWAFLANSEDPSAHPWVQSANFKRGPAIVVVTRLPSDGPQYASLMVTSREDAERDLRPPLFVLPVGEACCSCTTAAVQSMMEAGYADDVIWGAPTGWALALAIQAKLCQANNRLDRLLDQLRIQSSKLDKFEDIHASINLTRWRYLPSRLLHSIPPVQTDLQDNATSVAGFTIGAKLVRGLLGSTHVATRQQEGRTVRCSMLVIEKEQQVTNLHGLRMIDAHLRLLHDLSHYRHQNVSRLLVVFHTPKRLCVCAELCGPQTLYARLKRRDRPARGQERVPLPGGHLVSLMQQVCAAAGHLHSTRICHRDIKPENFTVAERNDGIHVKLGGFELARTQVEDEMTGSCCGTIPFAAPEVILLKRYDGLAADMWSVGVCFLEICCGIRSIERALSAAPQDAANMNLDAFQRAARQISAAFGQDGSVVGKLVENVVPEARDLRPWLGPLLATLLTTSSAERPNAAAVRKSLPS